VDAIRKGSDDGLAHILQVDPVQTRTRRNAIEDLLHSVGERLAQAGTMTFESVEGFVEFLTSFRSKDDGCSYRFHRALASTLLTPLLEQSP
jgi:hypothetical protein